MKSGLLGILGFSFGVLSAAGVFTLLAAVSLVPRLVGKTHTGREVKRYENRIIWGTIAGGLYSLYANRLRMWTMSPGSGLTAWIGFPLLALAGVFCGMFVGCMALAIAEMLDSLPIFARRVRLRKGTGILILSVAIGKLAGSLLYFWLERAGW